MKKIIPLILLLAFFCLGNSSTDFDGTNDSVSYGTNTTLSDSTVGSSIVVWFYCDTDHDGSFISDIHSDDQGSILRCDAQGFFSSRQNVITYSVDDGTLEQLEGNTNSELPGNWQWASGTASLDSPDEMRLYVDGVEQSDSPKSTDLVNMGLSNTEWRAGEQPSSGGVDLNGKLAYLQLWNRTLTYVEVVQAAYCPGTVPEGLQMFDTMLEGSGTHLDLSGNGMTGTPNNNATGSDFGPPGVLFCGGIL